MIEDDERDGRRHKLDAGFILTYNSLYLCNFRAKPASSFCHISAWIERRDRREAHLLQSRATPWQEFDGASSVFFVGML
jgi:hypothetical protein